MTKELVVVRGVLTIIGLVISVIVAMTHLGVIHPPCDLSCSNIRDWIWSPAVAVIALVGLAYLGYSIIKADEVLFRRLALVGFGFALALQGVAIALTSVCQLCIALALVAMALALSTVQRRTLLAVSALLGVAGLALALDSLNPPEMQGKLEFVYRPYEVRLGPGELGYVVFADPTCPACKSLSQDTDETKRDDIRLFYRWSLLPASSDRSLKAVYAIEAVKREEPTVEGAFRRRVMASQPPLTEEVILAIASDLKVRAIVEKGMNSPSADVMAAIALDGQEFERSGLRSIPQVLFINPNKPAGADIVSTKVLEHLGETLPQGNFNSQLEDN